MYEKLVKRLRDRAKREDDYYEHGGDIINEAADAIDELDTLLDSVRADNDALCEIIEKLEKPRWVSVTERLPSPMRAVLVYAPYKHNIFMAYVQGNKWYVWGPDEYCCQRWPEYHAITHWMNLPQDPEPPKEEE